MQRKPPVFFGAGETVTVLRAGERDRSGDRSTEFEPHHTLDSCGINWTGAGGQSQEVDFQRETVLSFVELYCPAGADILASDKVELPDGQIYNVVGKPSRWHSPFTGWEPGVVVRLKGVS